MNVGQGEDINSHVFEKLNGLERKKIGKQIEKSYPEVVRRAFPKDKILNANEAVSYLKKETRLDESNIRNSLGELLEKKEILPSRDSRGRLHLARMKKLY